MGIIVRFNIIGYFLTEGFRNVFKNTKSTFACLGVMIATMLMFGLFYAIGENVTNMVRLVEAEQGMKVFIVNEATDEEVERVGEQLRRIEGINTITFVSREEAFNMMRSRLGDRQEAMDGLPPLMFPPAYMVTLTDLNLNASVQNEINQLDNISGIQSRDDTINALATIAMWIRAITFVILLVLIGMSIFIISNTIKLTVHARRKEISIMKYVGATNNFIRTPFMIEGIIIGLLSGLLSMFIISGAYTVIARRVAGTEIFADIGINVLDLSNLINQIAIVYIVLGVGIGIVGSSISMRKYLDV